MPDSNDQNFTCLDLKLVSPLITACLFTHIGLVVYRNYLNKHIKNQDDTKTKHFLTGYLLFVLFLIGGWIYLVALQNHLRDLKTHTHFSEDCNTARASVIFGTALTFMFNRPAYDLCVHAAKNNDNQEVRSNLNEALVPTV